MKDQLFGLVFKNPIKLMFKVFYKQRRKKQDRSNVCSIVEKYFNDALVFWNCVEDDSDDYITTTTYTTGGVDKDNPRVEVYIYD